MAPVGSFESLIAAIRAGADSVYFGLGRLNMRARSAINFTPDDLEKIMRICRYFKIRAYLTMNVVFYDGEIEEMKKMIDLALQSGVNAIIASDQAAIHYAWERGMEVHLSTQVNISNTESLKFYSKFADVVVLARELNLEQVAEITRSIQQDQIKGPSGNLIRTELFVHGALCMAVSGKCYLSLHHHNHSANRGECLQDCRRSYTVREKESGFELDLENEYIMSPKDLCTIHFLNKIMDAGVKVFKIEGRARSPEYVKTVTECYHEAIQSYVEGNYTKEKIATWRERLSMVFNRGFWDGYYLGQKLGAWSDVYGSRSTQKKEYVAKAVNYFNRIGVADFLCEAGSLRKGDRVLIMGPTTGVVEHVLDEIRVDLIAVRETVSGERFSIRVPRKIRRADKLYKLSSGASEHLIH
ncbi:MAG: U32 family peptidase [Bacteroidales bacterium]|nr:U32 family peptidase [Bacteroidales bacterium]